MHRMHHFAALLGLISGSLLLDAVPASAALLRPGAKRAYPDIAADINGKVTFDHDPDTNTGVLEVTNTPYLIAGGSTAASEFAVTANPDGVRHQLLRIKLDGAGNLIDDPMNTYELRGSITANGQTFSDVLLRGKPTAFGSLDLGFVLGELGSASALDTLGVDIFDANIAIEGGSLSKFFGTSAYMRITPELESTFAGSFTEDFTAQKATSNTRGYDSPNDFPIPEPTTVMVLLAGGAGLLYRQHRRARRAA